MNRDRALSRTDGPGQRLLADPVSVIVEVVLAAEPDLDPAIVTAAIEAVTTKLAQQRTLARALHAEPALLTSGRPAGPPTIARLIESLRAHGAQDPQLPRCADCGEIRPLPHGNRQDRRICGTCRDRLRDRSGTCANCGHHRTITQRGRRGEALCRQCPPEPDIDHTALLSQLIHDRDPEFDPAELRELIEGSIRQRGRRREICWLVQDHPDLLAGGGPEPTRPFVILLQALIDVGVNNLVSPPCPFCQRTVPLRFIRDGRRCCGTCSGHVRLKPCARCGNLRKVCNRGPAGEPLCASCSRREPGLQCECSNCGKTRGVHSHLDDKPLCVNCTTRRRATCSICGGTKSCYFPATDHPICSNCRRKQLAKQTCSRCGKDHPVFTRTPDGQPLCGGCGARREPCARCARTRTVSTRIEGAPICPTCARREPALHRACSSCATVGRLHHHGLCVHCAYPLVLRDLLCVPGHGMRPDLRPVFDILAAASDPRSRLLVLQRKASRRVLAELAAATGPVTHEALDHLHASPRSVDHLRAVLSSAGLLPWRDPILINLETWLNSAVAEVNDPTERQALRTYTRWHHVKRVRAIAVRQPLIYAHSRHIRREISACVRLLAWLRGRGRTLATCTQADIDEWLVEDPRSDTRGFVNWAVSRRHAHDIELPVFVTHHTLETFPEQDQRWALVRRFLHDNQIPTTDRVAGLLVVLYAQKLTVIARLTTDQVTQHGQQTQLHLGTKPLTLPPPADDLVLQLLRNRRGHAAIGHRDDHPWLFPGGTPGRPLTAPTLGRRLKTYGIDARIGRNTALLQLSAELPAAVISQLLNISISRATVWAREAGNTRSSYAADIARRHR